MKKFKKILTYSLLLALLIFVYSCEDDDLESDSGKVVPNIFNFNGATVAYEGDVLLYSVTPPRGGSEYIWTVTGAQVQPIDGRTDKINVYFNQTQVPVSISVVEKAFNGLTSEASEADVTVFGTPCEWTVDMQDVYADGWNGASLTFSVQGIEIANLTLEDGASETVTVQVPNGSDLEITFNEGDYDEEVTYQVTDASGNMVLDEGLDPTPGVVYNEINICP